MKQKVAKRPAWYQPPLWTKLRMALKKAMKKALGGGVAGALAMVLQVVPPLSSVLEGPVAWAFRMASGAMHAPCLHFRDPEGGGRGFRTSHAVLLVHYTARREDGTRTPLSYSVHAAHRDAHTAHNALCLHWTAPEMGCTTYTRCNLFSAHSTLSTCTTAHCARGACAVVLCKVQMHSVHCTMHHALCTRHTVHRTIVALFAPLQSRKALSLGRGSQSADVKRHKRNVHFF